MRRGRAVALIGLLLAASLLAACSLTRQAPNAGGTPTSSAPSGTASGGASTAPPLTAMHLPLGRPITRSWSPKQGVQGQIRIRVTAIQQADWSYFQGWQVTRQTQRNLRPFFIHATVANVGTADLGGYPVPLYALDDRQELVEASTFGSGSGKQSFGPCHPGALPTPFKRGASMRSCLVMLLPVGSHLVGASFRPEESAQPVTWSGQIQQLRPKKHGAKS